MGFRKATKQQAKGRFAFFGPSGSGKSYSALRVGCAMAKALNGRVAAIDTERGSLSKYADVFDFDAMELHNFAPQEYVKAIEEAAAAGYAVLVIDSLSHAWMGKGGTLEQVDAAAKRQRGGGNSFTAWKDVTPIQNQMVDAILGAPMHVIVTMRVKTGYEIEEVNGKKVPRKVGLQPIQRDGMEYEFDVVGDIDPDNNLIITKTRCPKLTGLVFHKPGEDVAEILMGWLTDGAPPEPKASAHQVRYVVDLLKLVRLDEGTTERWWAKAGAIGWADMPAGAMGKCLEFLESRLVAQKAAEAAENGPYIDPSTSQVREPATVGA